MSGSSKEKQLWDACTSGDLDLVKLLLSDSAVNLNKEVYNSGEPALDVNWIGPEKDDTPLHRACHFGHSQCVELLLKHPQVEMNAENAGQATPFYIACKKAVKKWYHCSSLT